MNQKLSNLKGINLKSEKALNAIGIFTQAELEIIGPVQAFIKLGQMGNTHHNLNFLYTMVGALEDVHWSEIAKDEKRRLLIELEGYAELRELFESQDEIDT